MFTIKPLIILIFLLGCGTRQPGILDTRFEVPVADHTRFTAPCASCHEDTRLASTVDKDKVGLPLTVIHGFGRSCGECHAYDKATPSWAPISHNHSAADLSCSGCHTIEREGNPHEARGDCVSCHSYPLWITIKTTP